MRTVRVVQQCGFSDLNLPALCTPEFRIRAEKKPGRRLLSRAAGKLEEDNLFRIRKWNSRCTTSCAKISQKMEYRTKIRK